MEVPVLSSPNPSRSFVASLRVSDCGFRSLFLEFEVIYLCFRIVVNYIFPGWKCSLREFTARRAKSFEFPARSRLVPNSSRFISFAFSPHSHLTYQLPIHSKTIMPKIALVQFCPESPSTPLTHSTTSSSSSIEFAHDQNLRKAHEFVKQAKEQGAELVCFPEYFLSGPSP